MIFATHQADAYETPAELDSAIAERTGGFLRCTWKGSSIVNVTRYMVADLTMGGTHHIESADDAKGHVVLTCGRKVYANGYVSPPRG